VDLGWQRMIPALTIPRLMRAMPHAGVERVSAWVGAIEQAMLAHAIDTTQRGAMFLAQLAHESCELTKLAEDLRYSAPRLRVVFPRAFPDDETAQRYAAAGAQAIANRVYANRLGNGPEASGDGWRFRGRAAGITFADNYRKCSAAVCDESTTLLEHPELLELPEKGAAATAWFWNSHGCNAFADADDFDGACDVWNFGHKTARLGDSNGFSDRLAYFNAFTRRFRDRAVRDPPGDPSRVGCSAVRGRGVLLWLFLA
jgi:putative chitinase